MQKEHVLVGLLFQHLIFKKVAHSSGSKPFAFLNAPQVFLVWKRSHQKRPSQVGK